MEQYLNEMLMIDYLIDILRNKIKKAARLFLTAFRKYIFDAVYCLFQFVFCINVVSCNSYASIFCNFTINCN